MDTYVGRSCRTILCPPRIVPEGTTRYTGWLLVPKEGFGKGVEKQSLLFRKFKNYLYWIPSRYFTFSFMSMRLSQVLPTKMNKGMEGNLFSTIGWNLLIIRLYTYLKLDKLRQFSWSYTVYYKKQIVPHPILPMYGVFNRTGEAGAVL